MIPLIAWELATVDLTSALLFFQHGLALIPGRRDLPGVTEMIMTMDVRDCVMGGTWDMMGHFNSKYLHDPWLSYRQTLYRVISVLCDTIEICKNDLDSCSCWSVDGRSWTACFCSVGFQSLLSVESCLISYPRSSESPHRRGDHVAGKLECRGLCGSLLCLRRKLG